MSTNTYAPLIAWQRLRSGNQGHTIPGRDGADERPIAVVFRCADTTVASETVFGETSLIDVSTWGHAVDSAVIASLEHAVEADKAPLIVVLGHPECPAMSAAMRAWNEAALPDGAARTVVEHAIGSIVRRGSTADSVEAVTSAHIAETGLSILERSPVIAGLVNAGQCAIVCATTTPDGKIVVHATIGAVGEVNEALLECV